MSDRPYVRDDYTDEESQFIVACEAYRRVFRRTFPRVHEMLLLAKALGYRKVAQPAPWVIKALRMEDHSLRIAESAESIPPDPAAVLDNPDPNAA